MQGLRDGFVNLTPKENKSRSKQPGLHHTKQLLQSERNHRQNKGAAVGNWGKCDSALHRKPTAAKWWAGARPSDRVFPWGPGLESTFRRLWLALAKTPSPWSATVDVYCQSCQSLYEFSQGRSVINSPPFPPAFVSFVSLIVPKM